MKHTKIAIIGAGAVGTATAYALILKNSAAEILLVDVDEKRCMGEILDLSDALPFSSCSSIHKSSAREAGQADIIIITAGIKQKPDQARTELINANIRIVTAIVESIKPINTNAIIIVVTNPVDILTLCVQQQINVPRTQIFGTGTFLDTHRLRGLIAQKLSVAEQSVYAYMLGEHGDTQFATWSSALVGGINLSNFAHFTFRDRDIIEQQTRNKAYDIIAYKNATCFGIATCIAAMCEAIIFNQKMIMPLSCYQEKLSVCLSLPAILGEQGIEKILPIALDQQEQKKLEICVEQIKSIQNKWEG